MQTLWDVMFNPSGLDSRSNFAGDDCEEFKDWLVAGVITRDSDVLTESNWQTALKWLGGESEDVQILRFGHWACGWLEYLIVNPESDKASIVEEIQDSLEDYPVLDEQDYSDREYEQVSEYWADMSVRDRFDAIKEHGRGISVFAARRAELPYDDNGYLFDYLRG